MHARVVVVALFLALLPARADAQIEFCGPSSRACALLPVPLDRSGAVPGTVTLTIERMRAERVREPPLFLLAGGPGRSATRQFPRDVVDELLPRVRARRDVLILDQRGTGDSGALGCPALQEAAGAAVPVAAEQCAAALAGFRPLYKTSDSVADLDAVRAGLGYERIALFAEGYGTKVALDYAAAHPDRVDKLVLDSPVPSSGLDALHRASFAATPRVLRELCGRGCRGATPDPVADLSKLVRMLGRAPIQGAVITPRGRRTRGGLTQPELFEMLAAGDRQPGIRVRFPAAVHAAATGDVAPILRLERLASLARRAGPRTFSAATQAATVCEETVLPWGREVPVEQRVAQAAAAVAAEAPGAFAPFDAATALGSDVLRLCQRWPASAPVVPPGALPDVPVLILSGSQDVGTPAEQARRVASSFLRAQTLVGRGIGQRVLDADRTGCASVAVSRFLEGQRIPSDCPRMPLRPTSPDPRSLRAVRPARGTRGRPGRTLTAVRRTYQDALRTFVDLHEEALAEVVGLPFRLPALPPASAPVLTPAIPRPLRFAAGGLRSGSYAFTPDRAALRRLEYVPGVRLSGRLRSVSIFPDGVLRVRGRAAARGTLRVRSGVMSGRLGGRRVHGALGPDVFDLVFSNTFLLLPLP